MLPILMDARLLITSFFLIIILVFAIPTTTGLVLLGLYLVAVYRSTGRTLGALAQSLRPIALFVPLVVGLNAVLVGENPLPPPLSWLHRDGLSSGVYFGCRLIVLYLCAVVLPALASPEELAGGVAGILRPFSDRLARRVALYGFLIQSFLPFIAGEAGRIRIAQRFRGGAMEGGLLHRAAASRLLLVPLFMSAIHRSAQLAMVVESRRLETSIGEFIPAAPPRPADIAFLFMTIAILLLANLIR